MKPGPTSSISLDSSPTLLDNPLSHTMPLANGTRLGPFEILSAIGAGGPASARVQFSCELRRGFAVAKEAST
jgi:hypothetical protein